MVSNTDMNNHSKRKGLLSCRTIKPGDRLKPGDVCYEIVRPVKSHGDFIIVDGRKSEITNGRGNKFYCRRIDNPDSTVELACFDEMFDPVAVGYLQEEIIP